MPELSASTTSLPFTQNFEALNQSTFLNAAKATGERERNGEVGVVKDKDKARKNNTMQEMRTRHDKTIEDKR
jgi:hypothetical protein